ncbi:hypothetical protein MUP77_22865 [Candidatus Bathyarchaeota archaeon]|nr:hypothetical protein [Candidatus Bathyarchaeota archaeon]
MSGEVNRGKIAREVGVNINTVYNITGDLAKLGYVLAVHEKKKKEIFSPTPTPTPPTPTTNLPHGKAPLVRSTVRSSVRLTGDSGSGDGGDEVRSEKNNPPLGEKNLTEDAILLLADQIRARKGVPASGNGSAVSENQPAVSEVRSEKTSLPSGSTSPNGPDERTQLVQSIAKEVIAALGGNLLRFSSFQEKKFHSKTWRSSVRR